MTACHSLNGLDEPRRGDRSACSVGDSRLRRHARATRPPRRRRWPVAAVLQTVTTACHHCVDPACLNGCPVDAYEKDPITGIVAPPRRPVHRLQLLHADVPLRGAASSTTTAASSASATCAATAWPTARPRRACRGARPRRSASTVVDVADLLAEAAAGGRARGPTTLVPTAPRVVAHRAHHALRVARPAARRRWWPPTSSRCSRPTRHTPLAVMLVLTQLSVGAFVVSLAVRRSARRPAARASAGAGPRRSACSRSGASVLHLGRPLLRLAGRARARPLVAEPRDRGLRRLRRRWPRPTSVATWTDASTTVRTALTFAVALSGLVGVGCSAQLYAATRRHWWRLRSQRAPVPAHRCHRWRRAAPRGVDRGRAVAGPRPAAHHPHDGQPPPRGGRADRVGRSAAGRAAGAHPSPRPAPRPPSRAPAPHGSTARRRPASDVRCCA